MKRIMTQLLNLPEVVVESSLEEGKILILSVSKKVKNAVWEIRKNKIPAVY